MLKGNVAHAALTLLVPGGKQPPRLLLSDYNYKNAFRKLATN